MKKVLLVITLLLSVEGLMAQGFSQSVGIRAGWISPGIEYRYYDSDEHSYKAMLTFRNRGLQLYGLTEFHRYDLFPVSYQLVFFYGAGVHVGYESWDEVVFVENQRKSTIQSSFLAGLNGVVGLEYLFYEAPVKVGLEAKPFIDVFGRYGFDAIIPDIALTIKYLF